MTDGQTRQIPRGKTICLPPLSGVGDIIKLSVNSDMVKESYGLDINIWQGKTTLKQWMLSFYR